MSTEAEKVNAAGFMDDEATFSESVGPASVSIPQGEVLGVLSKLGRAPIQQPAPQADPYGRSEASGLPIVSEGRGGKDALTEAASIAMRAMHHMEAPAPEPKAVTLQEVSSRNGRNGARRVMRKVGKKRARRESKKGGVQAGDIVEHKKFGCLGTVVEATSQGMVVNLAEVGVVEVTRQTAPLYALIARGVINDLETT